MATVTVVIETTATETPSGESFHAYIFTLYDSTGAVAGWSETPNIYAQFTGLAVDTYSAQVVAVDSSAQSFGPTVSCTVAVTTDTVPENTYQAPVAAIANVS